MPSVEIPPKFTETNKFELLNRLMKFRNETKEEKLAPSRELIAIDCHEFHIDEDSRFNRAILRQDGKKSIYFQHDINEVVYYRPIDNSHDDDKTIFFYSDAMVFVRNKDEITFTLTSIKEYNTDPSVEDDTQSPKHPKVPINP